ncbi:MAG: sulfotransferase [Thiobacillus sp.]|nr:sulfotransferase [Thiobacillus sp.]
MTSLQRKQVPISEALKIALEHQRAHRIPQAEAIYRQVLAVEPRHPHALHLLGLIAYQAGDMDEARALIGQAIAVRADVPDYHANLGEAWRAAGEPERAIACYQEALRLAPDLPEIRLHLANALMDAGREAEAAEQYRQTGAGAGNDAEAIHRMADGLERMNRLQGARRLTDAGLEIAPDHAGLNLVAARLDRREGAIREGIARLQRFSATPLDLKTAIGRDTELGRLHDRAGEIDEAFRMFEAAGRDKTEMYRASGISKDLALDEVAEMESALTPAWLASWGEGVNDGFERPAPVFLIGFPRSGTTLLEQVLASHSAIATLEERPVAEMLARIVDERHGGYPAGLAGLSPQDILALRQSYFQTVDSLIRVAPGQTFVDKFPLNLVRLPLLARIFPDARYILALRHPADAVLSGFMQNFSRNSAMANFCTLEDAARFYERVMGLWRRCTDMLPITYHAVKYEGMVEDFDGEVKRLLDFLGLPWEDGVREFQQASRKGKLINTPSYHQVAEPIYRRAKERWRRYEPHLRPVAPILAPWVAYFGYADEATS